MNNLYAPYSRWNKATANCYVNKFCCRICELEVFCKTAPKKNPYRIEPMKYAVLMTYARIAKEGLEKVIKEIVEEV